MTLAFAVALFEMLTPKAPQTHAVLVAARSIRAGEVIRGGDFKAIPVASSQLSAISVSRRDQLVGHTANLDIAAGQPLVEADLGEAPGPGPGEAVLGLSLVDGRFPAGLTAGDAVLVVDAPSTTGGATEPPPSGGELASGRILTMNRSADGSKTNLSLIVSTSRSDAVAAASAMDSVSLIWITRSTGP
ncbi:MAG TPA: SAF domain-containing protein [Acidimicrobiales bacterium]|nr:SAF domain-containing protein [Acidimicrobiales bacterium]